MSERFFVASPIVGDRAVLSGAEAHHLTHVMRAPQGAQVTLFDGTGAEFAAEVRQIGRNQVELTVLTRTEVDRELAVPITLAVALPKGDRQRWLVEKSVELGVARLIPLNTARSVAEPGAGALTRLQRSVVEASKQCGRNRLMEIAKPQSWQALIAECTGVLRRLVAHPGGKTAASRELISAGTAITDPVILAVGPEGGLTDAEIAQALAAGWVQVDLGARILRVETAAVLMVALAAAKCSKAL